MNRDQIADIIEQNGVVSRGDAQEIAEAILCAKELATSPEHVKIPANFLHVGYMQDRGVTRGIPRTATVKESLSVHRWMTDEEAEEYARAMASTGPLNAELEEAAAEYTRYNIGGMQPVVTIGERVHDAFVSGAEWTESKLRVQGEPTGKATRKVCEKCGVPFHLVQHDEGCEERAQGEPSEHFHIWSELPCKPGQCRMEPRGEPSDAQVKAAARTLNVNGWTCDEGNDEPDNYDQCEDCQRCCDALARAVLRAAAAEGGEHRG